MGTGHWIRVRARITPYLITMDSNDWHCYWHRFIRRSNVIYSTIFRNSLHFACILFLILRHQSIFGFNSRYRYFIKFEYRNVQTIRHILRCCILHINPFETIKINKQCKFSNKFFSAFCIRFIFSFFFFFFFYFFFFILKHLSSLPVEFP